MKKKLAAAVCIVTAAIIAVAAPFFARRADEKPESASSAQARAESGYYLMEYKGMIGVFPAKGGEPISVLDVDVRTLPDEDRAALADGVFAADEDELCRRIEDYSS